MPTPTMSKWLERRFRCRFGAIGALGQLKQQLASIAVLTFAPALKFNQYFRRQGVLMPVKVPFSFVSSRNEPAAE